MIKSSIKAYDILGISSATLCMIHCIIFPLLTIIPFGFSDNLWIDTLFASIGMLVVSKVLMSNASIKIKCILGISILIIIINVVLEIIGGIHLGLLFVGGAGMIVGHYLNYKSHKN